MRVAASVLILGLLLGAGCTSAMSPLPEQESAQATAESFVNAVVEADYETVGRLTLERALSAEETDVLREAWTGRTQPGRVTALDLALSHELPGTMVYWLEWLETTTNDDGRRVNESAYVVVVTERDGAWYVTESP